ncbi:dihydrofolate reductase [Spinellus fusiger]|nr:dihydrofolate reductase [Spinellus fusiger]
MRSLALIVAATQDNGIGRGGVLPWRIPKDMAFFKHTTMLIPKECTEKHINTVVMGRVTWESIPPKFRPLPDRYNVVVSRNPHYDLQLPDNTQDAVLTHSLESALELEETRQSSRVFIIGGAQMYSMTLQQSLCTHLLVTRILTEVECDTFFPAIDPHVYREATHEELEAYVEQPVPRGVQTSSGYSYEFKMYIQSSLQ